MSWTKDQARALTDQILSFSRAEECAVWLGLSREGHTRFAANDITTAGSAQTVTVSVTSSAGGRSGSATTEELSESVLRNVVALSEALVAGARPNPEHVPDLGPQEYPSVSGFDEATALASPVGRRDGVRAALDRGRGRGLDASGFFETGAYWSAIAKTKGNFGFHRHTFATYETTMRTSDGTGSGYASFRAPRLSAVDPSAIAERAARKAETSARPRDFAPGRYTVILEPEAVADLLFYLAFSLNQRSADEGRSFLSKPGGGTRLGEKLFADAVTLRSDPFDLRNPGSPWASESLPTRKITWIESGIVKNLAIDRYWAAKSQAQPLDIPFPLNLVMEGSGKSLEDLIADTERALLVTRFWYIRMVNPQNVTVTGLTRDGVWLVEKGKIVHPVNNFRFNDSPINLLKNLEATTISTPVNGLGAGRSMIAPAIRATDFNFTSKSDAV
jgi:predicted Zn-dependent protease